MLIGRVRLTYTIFPMTHTQPSSKTSYLSYLLLVYLIILFFFFSFGIYNSHTYSRHSSKLLVISPTKNNLENSNHPCDTGSPASLLALLKDNHTKFQFASPAFDFSAIHPLWPDKTSSPAARSLFGYTRSAILGRARRALEKLRQRPEDLIFVFTHSAFLRTAVTSWWYFNADYRIFEFDDEGTDGGLVPLKMDQSTLEGGMGWSWAKRVEVGCELPDDAEEENGSRGEKEVN